VAGPVSSGNFLAIDVIGSKAREIGGYNIATTANEVACSNTKNFVIIFCCALLNWFFIQLVVVT